MVQTGPPWNTIHSLPGVWGTVLVFLNTARALERANPTQAMP